MKIYKNKVVLTNIKRETVHTVVCSRAATCGGACFRMLTDKKHLIFQYEYHSVIVEPIPALSGEVVGAWTSVRTVGRKACSTTSWFLRLRNANAGRKEPRQCRSWASSSDMGLYQRRMRRERTFALTMRPVIITFEMKRHYLN